MNDKNRQNIKNGYKNEIFQIFYRNRKCQSFLEAFIYFTFFIKCKYVYRNNSDRVC